MATPIFYVNGVPKSSANIGDTLYLDIPGYSQIWLTQFQNGGLQYDGPYSLPSQPYLLAARDVGTYQGTAYQMINGQKGQQIANWTFVVQNTSATQGTPTSTQGTPVTVQCLSGLCGPSAPSPTQVVTSGSSGPGGTTSVIPTGGISTYIASSNTPGPSGAGLSPFGDLPGVPPPVATTGGQTPSATPAPGVSGFDLKAFVKTPLFLLLVAIVLIVYFMSDKKGG
jgi:hypothetical protein